MPVILLSMNRLPIEVLSQFQDSHFVARLSNSKFNGVWIDYTLETTENKALKGAGGIIGLNLRGNALPRWFLSRPITAQYATKLSTSTTDTDQNQPGLHGYGNSSNKRWNDDVKKMTNMFDDVYVDPFDIKDQPNACTSQLCIGSNCHICYSEQLKHLHLIKGRL